MEYNNISKLKNCYGCGTCAASCPQDIIQMSENKDGFYEPVITSMDKCTQCGICLKVCSFSNNIFFEGNLKGTFASYSSNAQIRERASSGGVAFELAKQALSNGYYICGVIYDKDKHRAVHKVLKTQTELFETIGSKYIPSATFSAFEELIANRNQKYMIFGSPCQIASLRLLIRKYRCEDNFILVDFFCHGVPSVKVWDKYIQSKAIGNGNIETVKWRDKKFGWHDSYYIVGFDKSGNEVFRSKRVNNDEFFQFFLGHYALAPCCLESCKFKKFNSLADIRLGDLWGEKYSDNSKGINGVICFTNKGKELVTGNTNLVLIEEEAKVVVAGQMADNAQRPKSYFISKILLRTNLSITHTLTMIHIIESVCSFPTRVINWIRRKLNKLRLAIPF